jgi:hypothetical protein
LIKCWFNAAWGDERSDIVNFDWYHPPYAHRFSVEDLTLLAEENGLQILRCMSIKAQHYLEAQK